MAINDRQKALEGKFFKDQDSQFLLLAKTRKALARWAAEKLGKTDIDGYAKEIVEQAVGAGGDSAAAERIFNDLWAKDDAITLEDVVAKRDEVMQEIAKEMEA